MDKMEKNSQLQRFKRAASIAGADMSKEEFSLAIGKIAKKKLKTTANDPESDEEGGAS